MSAYTLCRLDQEQAEYLMMAPAIAGGWIAVHPDCREAVSTAIGIYGCAEYLALLPSDWDHASERPVTATQTAAILVQLDRHAAYAVVPRGEKVARDFAKRVRTHIALLDSEARS